MTTQSPRPYRAWIDQPSTLQPHHEMHGVKCIAVDDDDTGEGYSTIYFVDGPLHSMTVQRSALVRVKPSSVED